MYTLTASDFTDTGQWKLLLEIRETGMDAFLQNTLHPEIPVQSLCSAGWERGQENLRKNLEDAVYANPRLLDDFATRIVIYDRRTLFIPTELAQESTGAEEDLYRKIYKASPEDIMTDTDRDLTAVWAPGPGVKNFLQRSFPGCRMTCNLMSKVKELRPRNIDTTVYVFVRGNELDMVLLESDRLLSASTHQWRNAGDLDLLVRNLASAYSFKISDLNFSINCPDSQTPGWDFLKNRAKSVEILSF